MPLLFPSASPYPSPEEVWTTAFNELSQRIRRYFVGRSTTVQWHGWSYRKLSGGSVSFLRQFAWTHEASPRIVSTQELDRRAKSRKYLVRDCARNKKRQHNDPADDKRDKNAHRQARNKHAATTRVNLSAGSIR